jgi:insulysin
MAELDAALATPSNQRIPELYLPHKNDFIPGELKAENKDTAGPALLPCLLRDDGRAKVWWKKHPSQIPRTNVKISLKSPVIDASAESAVKARFFADLVRDALRGYVYDAKLAALEYCLSPNSRGFILDIRGYNDKLLEFLQQVCSTMKDLSIQSDRFDVSY